MKKSRKSRKSFKLKLSRQRERELYEASSIATLGAGAGGTLGFLVARDFRGSIIGALGGLGANLLWYSQRRNDPFLMLGGAASIAAALYVSFTRPRQYTEDEVRALIGENQSPLTSLFSEGA